MIFNEAAIKLYKKIKDEIKSIINGDITVKKADYAETAGSAKASDVSGWAKASTKPKYTYSEVGAAASSHSHVAADLPTVPLTKGGTGATTAKGAEYNLIGGMAEVTTTPLDDYHMIFKRTTPSASEGVLVFRKLSLLWTYIKGKADSVYAEFSHTHTKSQITDFPSTMTPSAHNQAASTITAGTLGGQVKANASAVSTVGTAQVRNIYAGTDALTAGSSALATGDIYIQYE